MHIVDQSFGGVIDALKLKMAAESPEVGQVDTEANVVRPEDLRKALDSADIAATAAAKQEANAAGVTADVPEAKIRSARESKRGEGDFAGVDRTFGGGDVTRGFSSAFRGLGGADVADEQ